MDSSRRSLAYERVFKVAAETSEPATKDCLLPGLPKMRRDLNQQSRGGFVTITGSNPPTPVAPAEDDMQAARSAAKLSSFT
jgi:hypothetical protein